MDNTRCYESEAITSAYAKHRNIYPKQLADVIIEYAFENKPNENKKMNRLVEVGCGSGQITKLLSPYFDEVIASDVSINQIKYANESNTFEHVKYVVGAAEDIQVTDQSADMVVSAESVFFFNLPKFFSEVARVLRPGGCLALIGYYFPKCSSPDGDVNLSAESCFKVLKNIESRARYNTRSVSETENSLAGIFQALPSKSKIKKLTYHNIDYNLASFKLFMQSVDDYQNKIQEKIAESKLCGRELTATELKELDLVEEFGSQLKRAWKMEERSDEEVEINATFKFTIILARNLQA